MLAHESTPTANRQGEPFVDEHRRKCFALWLLAVLDARKQPGAIEFLDEAEEKFGWQMGAGRRWCREPFHFLLLPNSKLVLIAVEEQTPANVGARTSCSCRRS
jgi:hypothetical protein